MNFFINQSLLLLLISSSLLLLQNVSAFSSPVMMVGATLSAPAPPPVVDNKAAVVNNKAAAATSTTNKIPRGVHAPIRTLTSAEDLDDFLNANDDRICVVKYYASWCKTCHRMKPKFQQFVNEHGDWYQGQERFANSGEERELLKAGRYRFASMEVSACKELFQLLNINKLPFVHLYAKGKQLSGFPVGGKRFPQLKEHLEYYEHQRSGGEETLQLVDPSFTPITDTTFTPELLQQLIHDLNKEEEEEEEEEDEYEMEMATEFDL